MAVLFVRKLRAYLLFLKIYYCNCGETETTTLHGVERYLSLTYHYHTGVDVLILNWMFYCIYCLLIRHRLSFCSSLGSISVPRVIFEIDRLFKYHAYHMDEITVPS